MATSVSNCSRGAVANPPAIASVSGACRGTGGRLPFLTVMLVIYILVAVTGPLWAPYPYDRVGTAKPFACQPGAGLHPGRWPDASAACSRRVVYGTGPALFMALSGTTIFRGDCR